MPFTLLHMGSGIVAKATLKNSFSLMVFGWSQIGIDIRPRVVMLTNKGELHGFSHTFLGATLIGLFGGLTGKHLGEFGLRFIRASEYLPISWRVLDNSNRPDKRRNVPLPTITDWKTRSGPERLAASTGCSQDHCAMAQSPLFIPS